MDDLYGDLPPASGEEKKEATGLIGSAWSSLPLNNSLLAQKQKDTKTNNNVATTAPTTVKTTKFVPSSLLFKPRQTSAAPSSSTSTAAPAPRGRSASIDQSVPKPQTVPIIAEQKPIIKDEIINSFPASIEEKLEFNNNSSFEVTDPYDPRRPNDYMTYCKEREETSRLEKLAEENKRRIEEMEQARTELERQRKEAAEKKDYKSLINSTMTETGAGRGRGRGLSNLPSWIVQQMKDEQGTTGSDPVPDVAVGQFEDVSKQSTATDQSAVVGIKRKVSHFSKPSTVVLLKNMVAAENVDESLAFETKMECQKYGSVKTCRIVVVDQKKFPRCPKPEQVRTFVQFDRQDSAVKALKEMNGRFFGGRQISAVFFDEDKFRNSQLDPDDTEY